MRFIFLKDKGENFQISLIKSISFFFNNFSLFELFLNLKLQVKNENQVLFVIFIADNHRAISTNEFDII